MTDARAERLAAAEMTLAKLLLLAPNNAWMHFWMGYIKNFTNRTAPAIAEFEQAVALDSNFAFAHAQIGLAEGCLGRAEKTEGHVLEALRLSPRDTWAFAWFAGAAQLALGADEKAVAWLRRSIESNGNFSLSHLFLAAALHTSVGSKKQRPRLRLDLPLIPTSPCAVSAQVQHNPTFLAQRERWHDGMRKAGVPEG